MALQRKRSILWIAPNLNHYKARFLKRLSGYDRVDLTILAGGEDSRLGHATLPDDLAALQLIRVEASKSSFHKSWAVYRSLFQTLRRRRFDIVLMPCEKKHIPLILFLYFLKYLFGFVLATYTHPVTRSPNGKNLRLNGWMTKFLFALYDRVVFYTEESMRYAVRHNLLSPNKAAYANNTLDIEAIRERYRYVPPPDPPAILFIGRLLPNKRLDLLFEYFKCLKRSFPSLKLRIIGDGPQAEQVRAAASQLRDVEWLGTLIDESAIAPIMAQSSFVFVPGHSGLSIVHAFAYGRPYVTSSVYTAHPPEIAYLKDGDNGLILGGDIPKDVERIGALLNDRDALETLCQNALATADRLSVACWCEQMIDSLCVGDNGDRG